MVLIRLRNGGLYLSSRCYTRAIMSDTSANQSSTSEAILDRIQRSRRELEEFIRKSHEQDAQAAKLRSEAPALHRGWEPAGWQLMTAGVATGATLMAVCYAVASLVQQHVCH